MNYENNMNDLNTPLTHFNLSSRSLNSLWYSNIETVEHLINAPDQDLKRIRNFGKKSFKEVVELREKLKLGQLTLEKSTPGQ
jgi:DNA-directed RNA polymerase subunit alpha